MIQLLNVNGQPYLILGEDDHVIIASEKCGSAIAIDVRYHRTEDPSEVSGWEISRILPPGAKKHHVKSETEDYYLDIQSELVVFIAHDGEDAEIVVPDGELLFGD